MTFAKYTWSLQNVKYAREKDIVFQVYEHFTKKLFHNMYPAVYVSLYYYNTIFILLSSLNSSIGTNVWCITLSELHCKLQLLLYFTNFSRNKHQSHTPPSATRWVTCHSSHSNIVSTHPMEHGLAFVNLFYPKCRPTSARPDSTFVNLCYKSLDQFL